ncbi:deoxyuridine 5'-triphosphate nucleotidohydrolase [Patescibacteria group bacterium]|nr:deoxyuridine 5'-triphosphate nucleotidohydrolase [Patescibacteria group bacterium]MBU4453016.1 deoxyuridine 5'-triphosphate nucleotidohydrolase [Patescibacteria group bacterium]MCG2687823.1 deoxyuridine 5'-triphosphate nucleotidohydrolase [Candidatus Parcubacteria bacterium]
MEIQFKRNHPLAQIPEYKTHGAVAFDIAIVEDGNITPRQMTKFRTGLIIKVPSDHALIIASRSSNPIKKGIGLANSIGIIDSDYCGPDDELHLLISNITDADVALKAGDRVAQGLFIPITKPRFIEMDEMQAPNRGGFGTTGR